MAEQMDKTALHDQIRAVIYGNCIGDALGLLTEFMSKDEAEKTYGKIKELSYTDKVNDFHRQRWEVGDWTDDSDQMILIMKSIIENEGKVLKQDFARRLRQWRFQGLPEFGDQGGMGIGRTTLEVLNSPCYREDAHKASETVWRKRGCQVAPNGGVMRTSILGCYHSDDVETVTRNTMEICKVTHFDPRCQASCVVVTTAIALMLQRKQFYNPDKDKYDVEGILKKSYENAVQTVFKDLEDSADQAKLLKKYVFDYSKNLKNLKLDEREAIGYTYKCLGSGCWAIRQDNFEKAMQKLVREAGDADTNGAVAGAMLGCKLGLQALNVQRGESGWLQGLLYKNWLDELILKFLPLVDRPQFRVKSDLEMAVIFKESPL